MLNLLFLLFLFINSFNCNESLAEDTFLYSNNILKDTAVNAISIADTVQIEKYYEKLLGSDYKYTPHPHPVLFS